VPHGAVLGRVTADGGLALDPAVSTFAVYLDTGRIRVSCPACGTDRSFAGTVLFSATSKRP
jgi:hypothetical protein